MCSISAVRFRLPVHIFKALTMDSFSCVSFSGKRKIPGDVSKRKSSKPRIPPSESVPRFRSGIPASARFPTPLERRCLPARSEQQNTDRVFPCRSVSPAASERNASGSETPSEEPQSENGAADVLSMQKGKGETAHCPQENRHEEKWRCRGTAP